VDLGKYGGIQKGGAQHIMEKTCKSIWRIVGSRIEERLFIWQKFVREGEKMKFTVKEGEVVSFKPITFSVTLETMEDLYEWKGMLGKQVSSSAQMYKLYSQLDDIYKNRKR